VSDLSKNKEVVRQFFEQIWNQKDESAIDKFIAEDAVGNDPKFGVGRESFRKQWRNWQIAFPDIHFEIKELIAEGETVVSRWHLTGTHLGPYQGVLASGKKISVDGLSIDRLANGMVISGFDAWDSQTLLSQIM
jgi:steroid delta-isomerase-like uncharacterized protein